MTFCTDTDLLHWEPNIVRDAAFASQLLLAGSGDLNGMVFTISGASLSAAHISANQVIALGGTISGSYPIVSVDSETQLTLSVLYDGLYPDSGPAVPTPVGSGSSIPFTIRTFFPQRRLVTQMLLRSAGIGDEVDPQALAVVTNAEALRRPCVLGTLHLIYSAMAAASATPAELKIRAELYERLYRRALGQTCVQIDFDGDGRGEVARRLGAREMARA